MNSADCSGVGGTAPAGVGTSGKGGMAAATAGTGGVCASGAVIGTGGAAGRAGGGAGMLPGVPVGGTGGSTGGLACSRERCCGVLSARRAEVHVVLRTKRSSKLQGNMLIPARDRRCGVTVCYRLALVQQIFSHLLVRSAYAKGMQ